MPDQTDQAEAIGDLNYQDRFAFQGRSVQSESGQNTSVTRRIAVIGGGLAGLSAAHRLGELARDQKRPWETTLFESGSRLGGIIGTERIGDYLVDVGADSFLTTKPAGVGLCRRLGIEDCLVATDARYRGALVLFDGRPVPIPEGFQLLSPTAILPVLTSPLFSVWGKIRLMMELFVPNARTATRTTTSTSPLSPLDSDLGDESLADFVRRRFGREALERLIQPLVGGIYTSDPEKLSLAATMPRFLEMERDFGSLIRASLSSKNRNKGNHLKNTTSDRDRSSGARYGQFAGLKGGMEDLMDALRKSVTATCRVRLNSAITAVTSREGLCDVTAGRCGSPGWIVSLHDCTREQFDAVILTVATPRAADLLQAADPDLATELRGIEYASSALVISGHRLQDVQHPLNSFGLVIPHAERRSILAVSFSSRKFPERAPSDRVLLRTFVGGALQPELFTLPDDAMIALVRRELHDLLGVSGEPDFVRVYRYPNSMPQYHVGHLDRIRRIDAAIQRRPGLALSGHAYRGVGVPDTIACSELAAEAIATQLAQLK